jgi:hypothetical protein
VLAAVGVVEVGADPGKAYLLAYGHVWRATDHFNFSAVPGVYATELETVGVGMGAYRQHFADAAVLPAAQFGYFADFYPRHGQPVGQLVGRQVNIYIFPQPA